MPRDQYALDERSVAPMSTMLPVCGERRSSPTGPKLQAVHHPVDRTQVPSSLASSDCLLGDLARRVTSRQ